MSKEPVMQFVNQESALKCLEYWKNKLFLNDWVIKLSINKAPEDLDLEDVSGEVIMSFGVMSAHIKILDPKYYGDRIVKYCAEEILVHELLHLKYNFISSSSGSFESTYYDVIEHQKLDQMAKSLIMVKYNLDFDWFNNVHYDNVKETYND